MSMRSTFDDGSMAAFSFVIFCRHMPDNQTVSLGKYFFIVYLFEKKTLSLKQYSDIHVLASNIPSKHGKYISGKTEVKIWIKKWTELKGHPNQYNQYFLKRIVQYSSKYSFPEYCLWVYFSRFGKYAISKYLLYDQQVFYDKYHYLKPKSKHSPSYNRRLLCCIVRIKNTAETFCFSGYLVSQTVRKVRKRGENMV